VTFTTGPARPRPDTAHPEKEQTMKTGLLSPSFLALTAGGALAAEIRVLNWQGYGTDLDWAVEEFAEATGHSVVHEYFNSEQEMLTKLRTNPGAFDVVLINAAFTGQAYEEGLLAPIDTSGIENYGGIPDKFAEDPSLVHEGEVYGVPWTWGLTAIAINTEAFDEKPTSLEVLWDPAYEGRVSIRDDAEEAVHLGALATGQDINDIADLDAVEQKLRELMPQLRTFWSWRTTGISSWQRASSTSRAIGPARRSARPRWAFRWSSSSPRKAPSPGSTACPSRRRRSTRRPRPSSSTG